MRKKNSEEIYALLKQYGSEANASRWAEVKDKTFTDEKFSEHNSCTKAYQLVDELLNSMKAIID